MDFNLDNFLAESTFQQLNKCKKGDLVLIANVFDIHFTVKMIKEELKQLVTDKLEESGLFTAEGSKVEDVAAEGPMMVTEQLQLTRCIRELDVRNRELEVEVMFLRVKA